MKRLNQKGFGIVEILLVIVLVGLVGGIGYYVYNQAQRNDETSQPNASLSQTTNSDVAQTERKLKTQTDQIVFEKDSDFSDGEKSEISTKVVNPFVLHETKIVKVNSVKIIVTKDKKASGDYDKYTLRYIEAGDEMVMGFSFGAHAKIGYWQPQLCDDGGCFDYPQALKAAFPESYKSYVSCKAHETESKDIDPATYGCYPL